jgi:hypothetical protein
MPTAAEVLLPLLAGGASAISPGVGRAVLGALDTGLAMRDQRRKWEQMQQAKAEEDAKQAALQSALGGIDWNDPGAIRQAGQALLNQGQVPAGLDVLMRSIPKTAREALSTEWRTDPATGQMHRVVTDAQGGIVHDEPWGGVPPAKIERSVKPSRDSWTDPATGQQYVDEYDEAGNLINRTKRGGTPPAKPETAVNRGDWLRQYEETSKREDELVAEMEKFGSLGVGQDPNPVAMHRRQDELRRVRALRQQAEDVLRGGSGAVVGPSPAPSTPLPTATAAAGAGAPAPGIERPSLASRAVTGAAAGFQRSAAAIPGTVAGAVSLLEQLARGRAEAAAGHTLGQVFSAPGRALSGLFSSQPASMTDAERRSMLDRIAARRAGKAARPDIKPGDTATLPDGQKIAWTGSEWQPVPSNGIGQ